MGTFDLFIDEWNDEELGKLNPNMPFIDWDHLSQIGSFLSSLFVEVLPTFVLKPWLLIKVLCGKTGFFWFWKVGFNEWMEYVNVYNLS